ncbi:TetR/AcrR family transcriptional regulator [Neotamlana laminarinivorans]|uniref:TetR/AcrR family transcriptional regulator n=1 Tax=Neotamlana laminarinivorans TaxID=2883124 RepID=A0A9X1L2S9_9FLAO|nr:TetR/AcrR family transcriptional regulator [Tamlana laminarinivorans]MCB4797924.1 TetR/AcrR family transcriptional regulator [Tamlana laminarinivorans]
MSKNQKDEFVKSQIMEASKTVFQKHGFRKANMGLIAKASGKGRSTLYYYYKNKEDVFQAFMEDFNETLIKSCKTRITKNNSIEENLSIYANEHVTHLKNAAKTYEAILNDLKQGEDFVSAIAIKLRKQDIEIIKTCLKWAIEKEEIITIDEENLNFLATIIVTTSDNTKKEFFIYETFKGDIETKINWINQLLIKSLKTI